MADETPTSTETTTAPTAETAVAAGTAAAVTGAAPAPAPEGTAAAEAPKADAKPDAPKEPEKAAEPVDYAKALSEVPLPEGMTLDPEATKAGTELFTKHNLSAEAAKDLVSLYAQQQKAGADGNAKAFTDQVKGWEAELKKSFTPEQLGAMNKAARDVFDVKDIEIMQSFGILSRVGVAKSLLRLSKAVQSDVLVRGDAAVTEAAAGAQRLYPNSKMNP